MSACLYAVTLAKNEQIRTVANLRSRLERLDFTKDEIDEAIQTWANYVAQTW